MVGVIPKTVYNVFGDTHKLQSFCDMCSTLLFFPLNCMLHLVLHNIDLHRQLCVSVYVWFRREFSLVLPFRMDYANSALPVFLMNLYCVVPCAVHGSNNAYSYDNR